MQLIKDNRGLLVQQVHWLPTGLDGGDSLCWTGHYFYLTNNHRTKYYREQFEYPGKPGIYHRHPDPTFSLYGWASEPNVESRDQLTGRLCYQAKMNDKEALKSSLWRHFLRGMIFASNTMGNGKDPKEAKFKLPDITLFDVWALYIRGLRLWLLYPLLLAFDIQLVISAPLSRTKQSDDIINHTLKCILANEVMPTPWIWLINRLNSKQTTMYKLQSYWGNWRKQSGMVELYAPYINKYWRG